MFFYLVTSVQISPSFLLQLTANTASNTENDSWPWPDHCYEDRCACVTFFFLEMAKQKCQITTALNNQVKVHCQSARPWQYFERCMLSLLISNPYGWKTKSKAFADCRCRAEMIAHWNSKNKETRGGKYFLRDVGHSWPWNVHFMGSVCEHLEGLRPIAPGHRTLLHQAWTHTTRDPLMSVSWEAI